jgi:excinuclease UvrABC helicase subunit UvrB
MRRDHERVLTTIVLKIANQLNEELDLLRKDVAQWESGQETVERLARLQDLRSRVYQMKIISRKIKKILTDAKLPLIATITNRIEN